MKIRALKAFEGMRDNERSKKEGKDIYPKAGEVWEVSEERAEFLKSHGVIEYVEEEVKEVEVENVEETTEEPKSVYTEVIKKNKKKKRK